MKQEISPLIIKEGEWIYPFQNLNKLNTVNAINQSGGDFDHIASVPVKWGRIPGVIYLNADAGLISVANVEENDFSIVRTPLGEVQLLWKLVDDELSLAQVPVTIGNCFDQSSLEDYRFLQRRGMEVDIYNQYYFLKSVGEFYDDKSPAEIESEGYIFSEDYFIDNEGSRRKILLPYDLTEKPQQSLDLFSGIRARFIERVIED